MSVKEGTIKFDLRFRKCKPLPGEIWCEINAWRKILFMIRLIGQDPHRYGGYAYGNVSRRLPPTVGNLVSEPRFVITGAQTSGIEDLSEDHYVMVCGCYPDLNRVIAEGPVAPSSESMTHGAVYAVDENVMCVMHAHSPEIWHHAIRLGIPVTDPGISYGTPEMAQEVRRVFFETDVAQKGIFSMGGHEDGIVSFGRTAEEAGAILTINLARAIELTLSYHKQIA